MIDHRKRAGALLTLIVAACAAHPSEETRSTSSTLKVGDNVPITTTTGFDTASVAVTLGAPDIGCPGGCPPRYQSIVAFQDSVPGDRAESFLNLDMWWDGSGLRSSAEWGMPAEQPSRAAVFSGYAGLPNIVGSDDSINWEYVGVGATGPEHFSSEVTVARRVRAGWDVHFLTHRLNPAYYPFVSTTGAPNGTAISNIAVAFTKGSYPRKNWVTWTSPIVCGAESCTPGVTFLTWYTTDDGTFKQGPTWQLIDPRTRRAIAEYGQAVMAVTGSGVSIAWPDAAPDQKWACGSTHPVNWHLSQIVPKVDGNDQAIAPQITDTVFLSDDDALECLPSVVSNPGPSRTNFRPTIFHASQNGSTWVGAPKHIVRNGTDYGTRIVMKSTQGGGGSFPIAGTLTTCTTRARVTETDFPLDDAPCDQFAATSDISRFPNRPYEMAMVMWHEAGVGTKGRT
jgi:hypothetical protein